jgi:hypothetical protein
MCGRWRRPRNSYFVLIASAPWMRWARAADRKRSISPSSTVVAMSTSGSYRESLARHRPNEAFHLGLVVVVVHAGADERVQSARSAMAEATAQFHKGPDQLALLPDNPGRKRQELEFFSALGAALTAIKGQAAPETGHAYARARELWEQLGSPRSSFTSPWGSPSITTSAANSIWKRSLRFMIPILTTRLSITSESTPRR